MLIKWPTTLQVGNVAAAAVAVAVVAVAAAAAVAVVVVISLFKLPDKSPRDFAANSQPVVWSSWQVLLGLVVPSFQWQEVEYLTETLRTS